MAAFLRRFQCKITDARQCNATEREQTAGQHAGCRALLRHAAPPDAHEEQRKITCRRDGKCLADHEIDFELLDL